MAVKLSPFVISKTISRWVVPIMHLSSVSSAIQSQDCSESCQRAPNRTEIDPKVQYLKNRLCPDELIQVLDKTQDLGSALKVFKWASLQKQFRHTTGTYYTLILKLGFAGNVDEMEGYCREMVKDRCSGAEEALGALVDVFVRDGRLDEAMRVVLVMNSSGYRPRIVKWNCLLGALVEAKRDFRDVLLVYKEMVKSRTVPSVDTLNYLIEALFDAGMIDNALDQFRRIRKKGCAPNCRTYEIVMLGLVASDRVTESLDVMNEMFESGVDLDLRLYTHVIPLLCRVDKLGEAMRLFDMMRASQLEPDISIYEPLVECLCENHRFREAIELFGEMRNGGLTTSTDVLMGVVNAYCKLENLDEARNLLDDSQILDPSPYNVLLQGYSDAHRFWTAKDFFCRMCLFNVVDSLSWNIFIRGLCDTKYVKQAYEVLGKMTVSSFVPDCATFSSLVVGKCNLSRYEDAFELFRKTSCKDMILDPSLYAKLIEGLCSLGKFQEATTVFMYMAARNCSLHSSLFSSLIKGLCVSEKVDEAIQLLKFGHESGNSVETATYTAIMHGLLRCNRSNHTLVLLSQMLRCGLVFDGEAYCILIQCMVAMGHTTYCVLFLNLTVSECFLPDSETLATLLSHLALHSQLHKIWTIICKLYQETEILDPAMYNLLINGLRKEGYKAEACQLLDTMLEKGWVPDAITHGLLTGSVGIEEEQQLAKNGNLDLQDEVSNILSEGLGET